MGFSAYPDLVSSVSDVISGFDPEETGNSLLILSSRFKNAGDTIAFYNSGTMRWLSPVLRSMSESNPDAVPSSLKDSDREQERAAELLREKLTGYLTSLSNGMKSYCDRLGIEYRKARSPAALADGIVNAIEINGFCPVGTYISKHPDPSKAMFGSFYVHCVLPSDLTWSSNFQARVSLHLANPRKQMSADPAYQASDYEIGDFFFPDTDPELERKLMTNLGIDIASFSSWLEVKRASFARRRSKEPSTLTLDKAVIQYSSAISRLYSEFVQVSKIQRSALNLLSVYAYYVGALKKRKFTDDDIVLPAVGVSGWQWSRAPAVEEPVPVDLDALVSGDKDHAWLFAGSLNSKRQECVRFADIIKSYQSHLRELLESLDVFASDKDLHGVSLRDLIDSYVEFFDAISDMLPYYAKLLATASASFDSISNGPESAAYGKPSPMEYWSQNVLVPIGRDSKATYGNAVTALWSSFSAVSMASLNELTKKLKNAS